MGEETILVIDDDENILNLIEWHLTRRGYDVITAYDGEQALSLIERIPVDLVITDLKMPKIDGMEVLRRVKEKDPNIEVVILTAHGTMESVIEALRDGGAFDYLQKPLENIKQLSFVTQKALERKKLRIENQRLIETLKESNRRLQEKLNRVTRDLQGLVNLIASSSDNSLKQTIIPALEALIEVLKSG